MPHQSNSAVSADVIAKLVRLGKLIESIEAERQAYLSIQNAIVLLLLKL